MPFFNRLMNIYSNYVYYFIVTRARAGGQPLLAEIFSLLHEVLG